MSSTDKVYSSSASILTQIVEEKKEEAPLHAAIRVQNLEMVRFLVENKASLNEKINGLTPSL